MTYQICSRCIMDTSDPDITFDGHGVCNHCRAYDEARKHDKLRDPRIRAEELDAMVTLMKKAGRRRPYDCVIGVSGGVDSTFVAYKVKELGLRPLAVHLDNGWDAELAVHNIERALKRLNIDLDTHVLDWDEFKDLQLSFLRASTPDAEIPTDHAIVATVYKTAWKQRIPYLVMGYNRATESSLPPAWSQGHFDWPYIQAVHARFGTRPLKTFPHLDTLSYLRFQWWHARRAFSLLNYIDYQKSEAMDVLQNQLGWQYYGGKHYESIYTRFFQGYILPTKFGYDKRRAHLSSLVCSGQVTRVEALKQIETSPYPSEEMLRADKEYVIKKLGLTSAEFEDIMRLPLQTAKDYPSIYRTRPYRLARRAYRAYAARKA